MSLHNTEPRHLLCYQCCACQKFQSQSQTHKKYDDDFLYSSSSRRPLSAYSFKNKFPTKNYINPTYKPKIYDDDIPTTRFHNDFPLSTLSPPKSQPPPISHSYPSVPIHSKQSEQNELPYSKTRDISSNLYTHLSSEISLLRDSVQTIAIKVDSELEKLRSEIHQEILNFRTDLNSSLPKSRCQYCQHQLSHEDKIRNIEKNLLTFKSEIEQGTKETLNLRDIVIRDGSRTDEWYQMVQHLHEDVRLLKHKYEQSEIARTQQTERLDSSHKVLQSSCDRLLEECHQLLSHRKNEFESKDEFRGTLLSAFDNIKNNLQIRVDKLQEAVVNQGQSLKRRMDALALALETLERRIKEQNIGDIMKTTL